MGDRTRGPSLRRHRGWGLTLLLAVGCLTGCGGRGPAGDAGVRPIPATARASAAAVEPSASPTATVACPVPHPGNVDRAPGAGLTVALTFDDGPGPWTPAILDVLASFGVPATFFDTGAHDAALPQLARAEAAARHVVADHSWDHRYPDQVPGGWTRDYLRDQFARTAALQASLIGTASCLLRAPGGFESPALNPMARELGMSPVGWSLDTEDWRQPGHLSSPAIRAIVAAAIRDPGPHPIVLMHAAKASGEAESVVSSYRGNTVAALPAIIRWYRAHRYRFVTMGGDTQPGP